LALVDDVRSTGSTVRQASRLLKECLPGIEIRVAVVAIAEREVQGGRRERQEGLDSWPMTE
jgi:adenine/guanine phosphoribosyltransferase-like PRPP-binding protein